MYEKWLADTEPILHRIAQRDFRWRWEIMDNRVQKTMREHQEMTGGEGVTETLPAERSPWGWRTLFTVSFLGGWAAGGIIAGINWRRMGRRDLIWPTIVVSVVTYLVWLPFTHTF